MGADIDFNPLAARAIDGYLAEGYESASQLVATLDACAEKLERSWHDESAGVVVELLRTYKAMYQGVVEKIPEVRARLKETARIYALQAAQKAAADRERAARERQAILDRYPDYDSLPKIGADRRGW